MAPAIDIENLSKTYPRRLFKSPVAALNEINLCVDTGEAFGFIGPNGAGKSTTIKILTGVIRASTGNAYIFGSNILNAQCRSQMGYVPESPYLNDYLTPYEVLKCSAQIHQVPTSDKEIMLWLERFGIARVAKKTIRSFSKGMTQRVALAQALCINPKLLILDEPLSGLDPVGRKDVVDILSEYKKQGGTLFFTSHVLHDVERLADTFGFINKGKLITSSRPEELITRNDSLTIRYTNPTNGTVCSCITNQNNLTAEINQLANQSSKIIDIKPTATLETIFFELLKNQS